MASSQSLNVLTERERRAIAPPPDLTVSEWADLYRHIAPRTTRLPGRWLTSRTPYLRKVMDSFSDHETEEIVLCFGTQLGKTESMLNMIGYAIDVDPGPSLLVLPTEEIAASISRNRIQPMIEVTPRLSLRRTHRADDFGLYEMKFETMTLYIAWSNSPAALSSRPVRYLFMDEVDKFPPFSGKEADPVLLAEKRTQSYFGFRKIVISSTPTIETGNVWKRLKRTNIYSYAIPCPDCEHKQILRFENVVWDGEDLQAIKKTVGLRCEKCGHVIKDRERLALLSRGEWILTHESGERERIGFHLSSLYSPFIPLYEVVRAFLLSKDDIAELMDFVNSYLAEPFKEVTTTKKESVARECIDPGLEKGNPPADTRAIVCGVDVQEGGFYFVMYAVCPEEVYLVLYGFVETWNQLMDVLEMRFGENNLPIYHTFIDAGARTPEVYDFCRSYPRATPCKGAEMQKTLKESEIERNPGSALRTARKLRLVLVNSSFFKDKIYRMLDLNQIRLHNETDDEFIKQLVAEEKRRVRRGFKYVEEWVRIYRKNHYLDATVYALACAEYFNVRHFMPPSRPVIKPRPEGIYKKARELWIPRMQGWIK